MFFNPSCTKSHSDVHSFKFIKAHLCDDERTFVTCAEEDLKMFLGDKDGQAHLSKWNAATSALCLSKSEK